MSGIVRAGGGMIEVFTPGHEGLFAAFWPVLVTSHDGHVAVVVLSDTNRRELITLLGGHSEQQIAETPSPPR